MKTKFLTLAAVVATLCSCTNESAMEADYAPSSNKIVFESPVVSPAVRGNNYMSSAEAYRTAWHFTVSAKYNDNTGAAWGDASNVAYMDLVDCGYNDAENIKAWDPATGTGATAYYWPKKGYLSFSAYSPTGATGASIHTDGSIKFTNHTVAKDGTAVDIMYSERCVDKQKTNVGVAHYATGTQPEVQIDFKHALAAVEFTVKTAEEYTGTTIKVKSIVLNQVYNVGDFTQTIAAATPFATTAAAWAKTGTAALVDYDNIVPAAGFVVPTTASAIADVKDMMVMPQAFNENTAITVIYDITSPSGTIEQTFTKKLNDLTLSDATHEFGVGKLYTLDLIFTLDKIYFNPQVAEWTGVTVTGGITVD